jgi:glycosyltransferase involved in cell wall biosynthesis
LLKALRILTARGKKVNLVLSGKRDREYKNLNRYITDFNLSNQVFFPGYITDSEIVSYYKNALALVMPTFFGPTNIPPIEAIILGCPPIVSNIYGMQSQLGNAALYFNPNDPVELADRIESILEDNELRKTLLRNGASLKQKFAQERFKNDLKLILEIIN